MSKGLNKVFLSGFMGNDPILRYTRSGDAQTQITLYTHQSWIDKETGNIKEKPELHRLVLYKSQAISAYQYLTKGSKVFIEGSLRTRAFIQKKDNIKRYTTIVVVHKIQFLNIKTNPTHQEERAVIQPGENSQLEIPHG